MSARKAFLLVQDDPYQRVLIEMEFQRPHSKADLHVVEDGVKAQQYISGEGEYRDREQHPVPEVILLDVAMPRADGLEFLTWLRSRPEGWERFIPVVVMAGSDQRETVKRAYDLGANAYLVKEAWMAKLRAQVKDSFWSAIAETEPIQRG